MKIDLHTHILPWVDDGAPTKEEALIMIEALAMQEIKVAVCTPHFDPTSTSMEEFIEKRDLAMSKMLFSKIKLIAGSETLLHEYLFHYSDLSSLCIGSSRYILLELQDNNRWDRKTEKYINKIIHYYNLNPIIAHIERYPAMMKGKILKRLKDMGCLFQVNTYAIINKKTKKRVIKYMKAGVIDLLGSDCHNMSTRPPIITSALEIISKEIGSEFMDRLDNNAECIIKGVMNERIDNLYPKTSEYRQE